MKVIIAHSGSQIDVGQLEHHKGSAQEQFHFSVVSLKQLVHKVSKIPIQNQILLLSNGVKVGDNTLLEQLMNEHVFVFDRAAFTQQQQQQQDNKIEVPIVKQFDLNFPPFLSDKSIDSVLLDTTKRVLLFLKHAECISESGDAKFNLINKLVQEQKGQARALEASYANLNSHSTNILSSFRRFIQKFAKHEERFNMLLSSFENDLTQLKNIELHPKLKTSQRQTLLDCVPEKHLRQWALSCTRELEFVKERVQEGQDLAKSIEKSVQTENISSPIVNYKQLSDSVRQTAVTVQNEKQIVDSITEEYNKLVDMINRQKAIPNTLAEQIMQANEQNMNKLKQCDTSLHQMAVICIESKYNLTSDLFDKFKNISILQYNIKRLSTKMTTFVTIMRNLLAKFAHLELVHYFPGSYSLALVEVLRRRKFLRNYASEIAKVSNKLSLLRDEEQENRRQFDKNFSRFLPPDFIPGMREKLPSSSTFIQSVSYMETSLPSIESPHEIQNIDMHAIKELCGSTLGHGVLKMYAKTLDENELFHHIELMKEPLSTIDDSYHHQQQLSRTSSSSSVHAPSYTSDLESPTASPNHSPRSYDNSHKILSQMKKQMTESADTDLAGLDSQLFQSIQSSSTESDSAVTKVQLKEDPFISMKENSSQSSMLDNQQQLHRVVDQYTSVLKKISTMLHSKTSDVEKRKKLEALNNHLDSTNTPTPDASFEDLLQILDQLKE